MAQIHIKIDIQLWLPMATFLHFLLFRNYCVPLSSVQMFLLFIFPLQLVVRATRTSSVTTQTADSVVTISVTRNLNGPVFTRRDYNVSIQDTTSVGTVILSVEARDLDVSGYIVDILHPMHTIPLYITSNGVVLSKKSSASHSRTQLCS